MDAPPLFYDGCIMPSVRREGGRGWVGWEGEGGRTTTFTRTRENRNARKGGNNSTRKRENENVTKRKRLFNATDKSRRKKLVEE